MHGITGAGTKISSPQALDGKSKKNPRQTETLSMVHGSFLLPYTLRPDGSRDAGVLIPSKGLADAEGLGSPRRAFSGLFSQPEQNQAAFSPCDSLGHRLNSSHRSKIRIRLWICLIWVFTSLRHRKAWRRLAVNSHRLRRFHPGGTVLSFFVSDIFF
ncbi:hypothetical protein GQ53DRAFT_116785 [Thozetella sp. PMI_491]|nr:hypothetical protein GQ53DRAFT_116785 [Thozetella sp. PMI_491]